MSVTGVSLVYGGAIRSMTGAFAVLLRVGGDDI